MAGQLRQTRLQNILVLPAVDAHVHELVMSRNIYAEMPYLEEFLPGHCQQSSNRMYTCRRTGM